MTWRLASIEEANPLLDRAHYLGPMRSGGRVVLVSEVAGEVAGVMVWRHPTSRRLPADGSWLELSRWCLTPTLGENAGTRCHAEAVRLLRPLGVTTLVSYSDPSVGHTGAVYRAANWRWAPTWHRLRPPPTGNGQRAGGRVQSVKDRWVFEVRPDARRAEVLRVDDAGAIRAFLARATEAERRLAARSLAPDLVAAVTQT